MDMVTQVELSLCESYFCCDAGIGQLGGEA